MSRTHAEDPSRGSEDRREESAEQSGAGDAPLRLGSWREDWSPRAVLTGMFFGGILSACNIYSGLKIGWSSNMSITGALLGFAIWQLRSSDAKNRSPFSILESNLAQTACSSAAAVSSAGLVAGIPALTVLTGQKLSWPALAAWVFSVCIVGIMIGIPLRRQLIVNDPLPFPYGMATAETLKQIYAKGAEAMERVRVLLATTTLAGAWKLVEHAKWVKTVALPGAHSGYALKNLTWALDPSLLLVAVGGLMGLRACISLLAGGVAGYLIAAPELLDAGFVKAGPADKAWFGPLVGWLLWPGVTLMVVSSLTSFALSWRSIGRALFGLGKAKAKGGEVDDTEVSPKLFGSGLVVALVLSLALQIGLFGIPWWAALIGVLLSFLLGIVAARVNGETGVTPVGAMGKVTQLTIGAALPGDVTANLMTANVTGGSASQCADLMNDLKTGHLLGSTPRSQWMSQLAGALAGAAVGSAIYLALLPDPAKQLFTPEWAAPAVTTWKAVAEVFAKGLEALPPRVGVAMAVAAALGVGLAVADAKAPKSVSRWLPSASALGLGFVVPGNQSLSMFLGGVLALAVERAAPSWHARLWIVLCSGVIAGESLVGVGISIQQMLGG